MVRLRNQRWFYLLEIAEVLGGSEDRFTVSILEISSELDGA